MTQKAKAKHVRIVATQTIGNYNHRASRPYVSDLKDRSKHGVFAYTLNGYEKKVDQDREVVLPPANAASAFQVR